MQISIRFCKQQGHCGACRRKWWLTDTDLCPSGETQTMSHIVESCPLTKLNGGLSRLHSADENAVSWLTKWPIMVHDMHMRRSMGYRTVNFAVTMHPIQFLPLYLIYHTCRDVISTHDSAVLVPSLSSCYYTSIFICNKHDMLNQHMSVGLFIK